MFHREILMLVLTSGLSSIAWANDAAQSTEAPASAKAANPPSLQDSKVLTGKERLGNKWTDEQRLDNCNVPIEKRGEKPRSDACARPTGL